MQDAHIVLTRRPLGKTSLAVTPIGFGFAALGDMPETFNYSVSVDQALATIAAAFESPVNFYDTAASYGDGESERRIGLALREHGGLPAGAVLSTKADRNLQTGDFSGDQMKRSVERSLELLGLDRIQIMFLHDPEHTTFEAVMAPGGPLEVLQSFRDQGVIDYLGIAGGPIPLMIRFIETGAFEAVITHNRYTLLNRSAEPLLETAAKLNVAVINAAPFGGGMLARGPSHYARYAYQDAPADLVQRAQKIQDLCDEYEVPLAAAALQFSLRDPRIVSTIVGISRPERVQKTIDLATHPIPEELWQKLGEIEYAMNDPEENRWVRER